MDEKGVFLKSFEDKLKKELDSDTLSRLKKGDFEEEGGLSSIDYNQFRRESLPQSFGIYEKLCDFSEKVLPVKPDKKTEEEFSKLLYTAHLGATPTGVQSAAILFPLIILVIGLLLFTTLSSTIGIGIILVGLGSYFSMLKVPEILAKRNRTKANDQIIVAVFYIVAFMRFNPNFELAVNFAANYLGKPLSLDFKRLLWEIENAKYPNIKTAFDHYLEDWRDENLEFLEAIYLIESSLFESEEFRRITLLEKALDTILQGNYEKMLHFAQDLRGKVSTFNMVGIVLPILGLIILPLAASFGDPRSTWEIVFLIYNIVLPAAVGYFALIIIFSRPSAVNSIKPPSNLKDYNRLQMMNIKILGKDKFVNPLYPAIGIFLVFFIIGSLPLILKGSEIETGLNLALGASFGESSPFGIFQEYKIIAGDGGPTYEYGPYGVYPTLLSLFIPLSFAFALGFYFRNRYKNLIHLRDRTKKLEREFTSATFQLGNRINEGISTELAFGIVAESMKGTETYAFFSKIDTNIKFNGMGVEKAIFDPEKGAINEYPSDLIVSSMKIFVKSIEKGPEIAAKTLIDLSKYLSEIHMSNERLLDLLSESLGSMKGQAAYLAPIISAVVISIVSLVTMILGILGQSVDELAQDSGAGLGNFLGDSMPPYLFQISVGIYLVILISILMYMTTNLEGGEDKIKTRYEMGRGLISGMVKYSILVMIGVLGFTMIGASLLGDIIS